MCYKINPRKCVKLHADFLYAYACTRINDAEQAKDLVQDTFLSALEKASQFKGNSAERTWLTAILKNKIIDVYRKRSSAFTVITADAAIHEEQDFFNADDGHWNEPHYPRLLGIEEQDPLNNKELTHILQQCFNKLPALWLSVFTMKHLDDASSELICAHLKLTPSNFWVIIHRAKLNLRACLQKNWL